MNTNICVLEDSEEILNIIQIVLEQENYDVHSFTTVSEFMAGYQQVAPALCLLDVMLPDGSGLEVCSFLKNNDASRDIPVVIMTANSQIEAMKEKSLADDFIAKPFDIDDLARRIALQINNHIQ